MKSVASSPPEQGQLVNLRQRQWVVKEVAKTTFHESPLQSLDSQPQYLVTLSSVVDDGLDEERHRNRT